MNALYSPRGRAWKVFADWRVPPALASPAAARPEL